VYFATAAYGFDGSVMITASHNPAEYNGLKISRAKAVPMGYDTGLRDLESMVAGSATPAGAAGGSLKELDIRADYLSHLSRFTHDISGVSAVIDCSNGTVGVFLPEALSGARGRFTMMFAEPDGRFPNHPPNPLVEENLTALKQAVRSEKADLGICFDGDADRVMFVDEDGTFISPDLLICLIGDYYFRDNPGRLPHARPVVTYDVRSSRSVVERLRGLGADPRICKVGHSYAKKLLRDLDGIFGGELAGHYYFRENYFCDSGMIAAFIVLSVLSRAGKPLSELIRAVSRYSFSGELNFKVENAAEIMEKIRADYAEGSLNEIDGIRVDYPTWWFNLRRSNTEPLLRLVLEGTTAEEMREKKEELLGRISRYSRGATAAE
jgi:phosphomannomutase